MGSYVQNIKTESGDTIYPITSTKAVFDSEGKPIDEVVEEVKTTVNETISNIPGQLQKVQQTINTSLGNADISSIGDGTIKGAINALKENFKAGVDAIYNKIVAKGVTPASKTPSDCASAIDTACTNHYNSGVAATKKGTAGAGDVLAGKTFTNSSSVGATGTMTNRGAWTGSGTPSGNNSTKVTVPAGYHNGSGYVTCNGSTAYSKGVTEGKNSVVPTYINKIQYGSILGDGANSQSYTNNNHSEEWVIFAIVGSGSSSGSISISSNGKCIGQTASAIYSNIAHGGLGIYKLTKGQYITLNTNWGGSHGTRYAAISVIYYK